MNTIAFTDYINSYPIFGGLDAAIGDVRLVYGTPTEVIRMFDADLVQAGQMSLYAYLQRSSRYTVSDDFAIVCSRGSSLSVLLLSDLPIDRLSGETILLTTESATAVRLLRLLMTMYVGVEPLYTTDPSHPHVAQLLIGDAALRHAGVGYTMDLVTEWTRWTGLPFVFAVFVRRTDCALPQLVYDRLLDNLQYNQSRLSELAQMLSVVRGVRTDLIVEYFGLISYRLGDAEHQAISEFAKRIGSK